MEQLKFHISTTNKNKEMKITHKQIVVLLEALWDFKESIQNKDTTSNTRKRLLQNKQEEVDKLFNYLQDSINYNFEKQLKICNKKYKKDDAGQETFNWL